jgi:PDDEXK-like domain of unknown function (DUF3799)
MSESPEPVLGPGRYPALSMSEYQADPCPRPSLSASIAHVLLSRSPLHAWTAHPRLNPEWVPETNERWDLGAAAHMMVLRGDVWKEEITVCDFPDWRSKNAQTMRAQARTRGRYPVLLAQYAELERLVLTFEAHPARRFFRNGTAEVSLIWQDPDTGLYCRCRPDWLPDDPAFPVADYKTTENARPDEWARRWLVPQGGLLRAAFYAEGLRRAAGIARPVLCYVVQEIAAPYAITVQVIEHDSEAMAIGRAMVRRAMDQFAECLARGVEAAAWPGYESTGLLELPSYQLRALEAAYLPGHGVAL